MNNNNKFEYFEEPGLYDSPASNEGSRLFLEAEQALATYRRFSNRQSNESEQLPILEITDKKHDGPLSVNKGLDLFPPDRRACRPATVLNSEYSPPDMHAPELAGDRNTAVRQENGVRTWDFLSGARILQYTDGPLAGAQVLQDRHGRVLRLQEASAPDKRGHATREVEFEYPPGDPLQNRLPIKAVVRDAVSGETVNIYTADKEQTTIVPGLDGFVVQTTTLENNPIRINTAHHLSGIVSMEVLRGDGSIATSVTRRDGQVDNFRSPNADTPPSWGSTTFAVPRDLVFDVNGENQSFPGVNAMYVENGSLCLAGPNGSVWRLIPGRNGSIATVEYETPRK